MFSITRKTKENISLTVSLAGLLISVLWLAYHMTLTANTNLSDMTVFHGVMLLLSVPFGGLLGPVIAPAVASLTGFFSTANYWHTDRPNLRTVSRVALIAQGVLTVALAVFVTVALTR